MEPPDRVPPYRVVGHTADTGIETTGPDYETAVERAAYAMFDLMFDLATIEPMITVRIEVTAEDPADRLVEALSELLYRAEIDNLVMCRFEVTSPDERTLAIAAGGAPSDLVALRGAPIKAVTYHQLAVEPSPDGWRIRVLFDV